MANESHFLQGKVIVVLLFLEPNSTSPVGSQCNVNDGCTPHLRPDRLRFTISLAELAGAADLAVARTSTKVHDYTY